MDLNYLLHRHQISLAMAASAASPEARAAHRGMVAGYADKIHKEQLAMNAICSAIGQ